MNIGVAKIRGSLKIFSKVKKCPFIYLTNTAFNFKNNPWQVSETTGKSELLM